MTCNRCGRHCHGQYCTQCSRDLDRGIKMDLSEIDIDDEDDGDDLDLHEVEV